MAIDSMNKVIHAAVRRDFGRLDRALAAVGDGDRARAADLYRAWALIPHLASPEWKAAQKEFRKQPPKVAGWFFAWVQDGMTDEVRAFLGSTVPAPVRMILSKVFGRGYHRDIAPVWA